jgi:hypothetical protein
MPNIERVEVMTKQPGRCVCCGTSPTEAGNPLPAIDLNVDVDWGNNAYLCTECVDVICDLWGRVSREKYQEVLRGYKKLRGDHQRLRRRYLEADKDRKILANAQAAKERIGGHR